MKWEHLIGTVSCQYFHEAQPSNTQSQNTSAKLFSEGNHQYPTSLQGVKTVEPIEAPFPRASGQIYLRNEPKTYPFPPLPLLLAITFHMEHKSFSKVCSPASPECGSCFNEVSWGSQIWSLAPAKGATKNATQNASLCAAPPFHSCHSLTF